MNLDPKTCALAAKAGSSTQHARLLGRNRRRMRQAFQRAELRSAQLKMRCSVSVRLSLAGTLQPLPVSLSHCRLPVAALLQQAEMGSVLHELMPLNQLAPPV